MKLLTVKPKKLLTVLALFLTAILLLPGFSFLRVSAEDSANATDVISIETNVEGIIYSQHPTCVFFGFKLTESDYDDFPPFEGDFGKTPTYNTYEKYIALDLTYWKNFPDMNSKGVRLDQLYAYWNGSSVGTGRFANTVTHRSTLALLEYGFVISIPAGTTFPSATYVKGNCEGTPIMYTTTEDKAFYFDGTAFKELAYNVAQMRTNAQVEVAATKTSVYYETEKKQVKALIAETKGKIELCFTTMAVQETLAEFYDKLAQIMTKEDYAALALRQQEAKASLATFFSGLTEGDYDTTEWAIIQGILDSYETVIDGCHSIEEVNGAVSGIKYSVDKVLKTAEKADFETRRAEAAKNIKDAFEETLYRDAEREQGAALVEAGKALVAQATTYDELDAIEASYIASIDALKTDAEWTEEENRVEEDKNNAEGENEDVDNNQGSQYDDSDFMKGEEGSPDKSGLNKLGCQSTANEKGILFGVAMVAALMMIKNKKRMGYKDEN